MLVEEGLQAGIRKWLSQRSCPDPTCVLAVSSRSGGSTWWSQGPKIRGGGSFVIGPRPSLESGALGD